MEKFVLVSESVYNINKNNNKSLDTLAVTKQELPEYPAEQSPTNQTDSLKKK